MTIHDPAPSKTVSFAELTEKSASAGTFSGLVLYQPTEKNLLKAKGTLRQGREGVYLQLERFWTEGRVTHENIPLQKIAEILPAYLESQFRKADLTDKNGSASLMISSKGKITLLNRGKIGASAGEAEAVLHGNDRKKKHLLDGTEPFLQALDIADKNGRIHDKRQAKFRQICRFTEYIRDAVPELPETGVLHVADLCCGKSYLSFAVYHYLTAVCGREVNMVCVDLKESVIEECASVAKKIGYDGMHFICGNIFEYKPENPPAMVISLHACDTATDAVLEVAMREKAKVILSTPCCHHDMNKRLNCAAVDFIGERPMLRQKFCDAATDALRLLRLDAMGYKTDATELIDPEETPKNILLRGYLKPHFKRGSKEAAEKWERYRSTYLFLYGEEPPALPEA
ncbi:MAG: SAM-dependent methyltransferase [Ruminococcaceae bacterium]|nr:SAM-dependent methyltransferase [Oscillospiraceae bacterium]